MKKALSLLLAVLMLVSLFSGMAFADDDVIVEEPAAVEEPVAVDEIVGDDFAEAADAYVEEYTDEGSFEAADAYTPDQIAGLCPENPGVGQYVLDRWESPDGTVLPAAPTKHEAHAFAFLKKITRKDGDVVEYGDPEKYEVVVPHTWLVTAETDAQGWKTVYDVQASCEEEGWQHDERVCSDPKCKKVETRNEHAVPMTVHHYVQDKTYTGLGQVGDDRAVVVAPTCKADGVGHWVCDICGAFSPDQFKLNPNDVNWTKGEYPIVRKNNKNEDFKETDDQTIWENQLKSVYHAWGDFTVIKPATCLENGTKAHYCNICKKQETQEIKALDHKKADGTTAMVFDHIERLDCENYAEVWVCSNPECHTQYNTTTNKYETTTTASQRTDYVIMDDGTSVPTLEKAKAQKDNAFAYTTKNYKKPYNHNTEYYDHHRFTTGWTLTTAPQCCVLGEWTRVCADDPNPQNPTHVEKRPEPALEPIFDETLKTTTINGHQVHYVSCTRPECKNKILTPIFPNPDLVPALKESDPNYYSNINNANPQAMVIDHDWGEWTCYVKPTATTLGHWTRTCQYMEPEACHEVQEFVGTQKQFDEMNAHPVLTTGLIPEIDDGVVVYKLYMMGIFQKDVTGVVECYCEGVYGKFYVKDGIWQKELNGAKLDGETWYFLANGKVCEVNQLCEYQSEWFYVKNGVIDTTMNGLVDYDGGTFMLGAGRIQKEVSGLWENSKSIGGDGEWYYLANGQVQKDYTGLVQYDGEWFYVENGKLVPFNGTVEYDGEKFEVKNGMVVA